MKKTIFTICFLLVALVSTYAQTGVIKGTQIRIAEKPNGVYNGWTTDWIILSGEDQPILEITEDKLDEYYIYYITFTYAGVITEGTYVYDPDKSVQIRKEWDKKVVNCYVDEEGDYVYVEDTSFQELARNSDAWIKYPNSAIQFINSDENIAFK